MASGFTSISDLIREDFLSCKICYELYRAPKLLPCLHTYCQQCLEPMVTQGSLQCPECRLQVPVKDGVKNLKSNFFINSLLDVLQPKQTKDLACSVCVTAQKHFPATSRCLDCRDFLCRSCTLGHRCSRTTISHRVVDLKEFMDGQHDAEVRLRQEMFCPDHQQEPLRFFCDTCNASICRDCRLLGHLQHQVVSLSDAVQKKKPEVKKLIEGLECNIWRISEWENDVTGSLRILSRAEETIKESITAYMEEATAFLQGQKEAAFKELDAFLKQETEALLAVKQELQSQRNNAVSTKEFSHKVMDVGNDSEILSIEDVMRKRIQELQSFTSQQREPKIPELVLGGKEIISKTQFFKLVFPAKNFKKEPEIPSVSEAHAPPLTREPVEVSCAPQTKQSQSEEALFKYLQLEVLKSTDSRAVASLPMLNLISSFYLEQDDDEYESKITGIAAFPGAGGILLVDQPNNEIKRFSMSGDLRRTIKLDDEDLSPCSVAVCGNTLACSAENYLFFMTLGGNFLHKLKLRSLQDDPQYPITSYSSQYVAVSEGTLCSVSLYNTKGLCLDRVKPHGYQGGKFLFIAVNSNEEFIISDVVNKDIIIFERSGNIIHILDASNSPFSRPFSLCIDNDDHIFVVDEGRVIRFSEDGQDGQVVLSSMPGPGNPRMIVIDSSGRLVLVDKNNYVWFYEVC